MRMVVIIFSDNEKMTEFILSQNISRAEVNSREQTLTALLDEDDIITAFWEYGDHLHVELKPNEPSC